MDARAALKTGRWSKDPEKERVRSKTWTAIHSGQLLRQSCQRCGEAQSQAHHRRYEGEGAHLDIEWLCALCRSVQNLIAADSILISTNFVD